MLITNAEVFGAGAPGLVNIRLSGDRIARIGSLSPEPGEAILDAAGGALLPGLHDHHIHLLSYAASLGSVRCGPPQISTEQALIEALRMHPGSDWLRGYGYHDSVAGEVDRAWLDQHLPDRPARIQHRSGRLWILNSAGLDALDARREAAGINKLDLPADGRLYDQDRMIGAVLGRQLPPVGEASQRLAEFGVTGITDMTPSNDRESLALFSDLRRSRSLLQSVQVAGSPALPFPCSSDGITTSATKIHLHDSALPPFDQICELIRASHAQARPVAVHCVTEVELVFALAAIEEAGSQDGDRIEHASVTPPHLLDELKKRSLTVVTQPNFIWERGDAYLQDVPAAERPWLYRARSLMEWNIPLAGGTDAPFGSADPWLAIRSAVQRQTPEGHILGHTENLSPEESLALFLGEAGRPATPRRIEPGAAADLCVLNQPWKAARNVLSSSLIRATISSGRIVFDALDQPPTSASRR